MAAPIPAMAETIEETPEGAGPQLAWLGGRRPAGGGTQLLESHADEPVGYKLSVLAEIVFSRRADIPIGDV